MTAVPQAKRVFIFVSEAEPYNRRENNSLKTLH